ncbi:MAG: SEC-C metal-binding domain-containing protein [Flavobacteriales bacterium]
MEEVNSGRNDKCPCGNDSKFKHCHLQVFEKLKLIGEDQVRHDFKLVMT